LSLALLLGLLPATGSLLALANGQPPPQPYCFAASSPRNYGGQLTVVSLSAFEATGQETPIGSTRARKIDAIALHPVTGELYGADSNLAGRIGYLGTFDLATGRFTRRPLPAGVVLGSLGAVTLYDFSGLAFDPLTGVLYVTHVRYAADANRPDVLAQLNPVTGTFVPNAFGPGQDYVPLNSLPAFPHLSDVDDIAIDPTDGQMYGILNNSHAPGDRLVKIDKATGAVTDVGPFGLDEVEGLDFDPRGQLWATAGSLERLPNHLWQVDKRTGQASHPRPLDHSQNYEALACMVSRPGPTASLPGRHLPRPLLNHRLLPD
jgi:hypothetical protein